MCRNTPGVKELLLKNDYIVYSSSLHFAVSNQE